MCGLLAIKNSKIEHGVFMGFELDTSFAFCKTRSCDIILKTAVERAYLVAVKLK